MLPLRPAIALITICCLKADPVDDFIAGQMRQLRIPGLSIAVVQNGRLVKAAGYGVANLETNTPATPETVYNAASLSKPIFAAAIQLLAHENKLTLEDKAAKFLTGTPESWSQITVRHLLTHTSGLPRDPSDYQPYKQQPPLALIESLYPAPLNSQPGEKWLYSNIGYYVVAEIITKASGKPWQEFIQERLLSPAGMTATRPVAKNEIILNRATGYEQTAAGPINAETWIAARPSAAYLTTAQDLANWDIFLEKASFVQPRTRAKLSDGKSADYGLGWHIDSYLGQPRIHHDAQYPGFRADYERFEDNKLTIIVLANSGTARLESLAIKIAGFYDRALTTPPFTVTARTRPGQIEIEVTCTEKPAPESVIEMEIWDESVKAVNKQNKTNQSFAAGETKTYHFPWTPAKPGTYTVNVGVYGKKWTPSYSWNQALTSVHVQ